MCFFFFKQKTAYEMRISDGSSDVCSSDLGTVTAVTPDVVAEVTTLRRDVSTDGRRATVAYTDDWREDAERRDFTINALYAVLPSGEGIDFFGGLEELKQGRVRFIGHPIAGLGVAPVRGRIGRAEGREGGG